MSVSEPGTWTIFTHVVLLCVLKASVMCFRLTESGGVCEVQNVARFVPELQPASGGAVEVLPPPHAASTTLMKTSEAFQPRLPSNDMAITSVIEAPRSPRLLPGSPHARNRGESAPTRGSQLLRCSLLPSRRSMSTWPVAPGPASFGKWCREWAAARSPAGGF